MTKHTSPKANLPLNDAGIALAQSIESYCKTERIPFDGIWCTCPMCSNRIMLVRAALPRLKNDSVDELRLVCFTYWRLFRRKAAQA